MTTEFNALLDVTKKGATFTLYIPGGSPVVLKFGSVKEALLHWGKTRPDAKFAVRVRIHRDNPDIRKWFAQNPTCANFTFQVK